MITWIVVIGLVALVVISLAVGASLDTAVQRHERRRLADTRRARAEENSSRQRNELCERCPLRLLW